MALVYSNVRALSAEGFSERKETDGDAESVKASDFATLIHRGNANFAEAESGGKLIVQNVLRQISAFDNGLVISHGNPGRIFSRRCPMGGVVHAGNPRNVEVDEFSNVHVFGEPKELKVLGSANLTVVSLVADYNPDKIDASSWGTVRILTPGEAEADGADQLRAHLSELFTDEADPTRIAYAALLQHSQEQLIEG